ncbi:DUF3572 domain-containing protein [Hoeflea prorocentri]|uniref:DUF3572 domain-containing protein n=2 Tax=Hoeflea prorocentri TaxID=1922333 RepID=A0A9X3UJW6_9HYPH|nr:DUF3572 domain-containing protein [Hoeflea prorocentri]MCY6380479.1 DUF3572 domain-containing protein [Hoeflea prorocentri]MDA5398279.1 DUF3572 domain-containing protein [Hoeflea prorocentri]
MLAVDILSWIASDDDMMNRFLAISGLSVENLREAANEPGFLAGVVGFLTAHEPSLLAYCEARGIEPETVASAWRALGGDSHYETSI